MEYFNINGKILKASEANIHITDMAILRGYGAFDFLRVRKGKPLFIDDYLERLFTSAKVLDLEPPLSKDQLRGQVERLVEMNEVEEASIRLVLTGGFSEDGIHVGKPNLLILEHLPPNYDPKLFDEGAKLISWQYQRELPSIKSINYLTGISLNKKLKETGALEALYHDGTQLLETIRSNILLLTEDSVLVSPEKNVLPGITLKHVLNVAEEHYEIQRREILLEELDTAKEFFITSSTKGVMPITTVDNRAIGKGKPGPAYKQLSALFEKKVEQYLHSADK